VGLPDTWIYYSIPSGSLACCLGLSSSLVSYTTFTYLSFFFFTGWGGRVWFVFRWMNEQTDSQTRHLSIIARISWPPDLLDMVTSNNNRIIIIIHNHVRLTASKRSMMLFPAGQKERARESKGKEKKIKKSRY
jgi:hypothetical protein